MDPYHVGPVAVLVVLPAFETGLLGMPGKGRRTFRAKANDDFIGVRFAIVGIKSGPLGAAGLFDANFCPASRTIDDERWH
jgi:hypothetical protein